MAAECTHLNLIHNVKPHTKGCEECLKMGDTWVHLRLCLVCGHVGGCVSSSRKILYGWGRIASGRVKSSSSVRFRSDGRRNVEASLRCVR